MSVVVFSGPTISSAEIQKHIDAICLPPAQYGDVLRTTKMSPKPRVIAIIDGAFRTVPAVRHKEILWALSQGIHVYGAASMGALRASELWTCGMIGVGSIFSDYRSGRLEDDDEVAVEHGPSDLDYMPLSDAMVDIRATLDAAVRDGVIDRETKVYLIDQEKQQFYADRRWRDLLRRARDAGLDHAMIDALERWLPIGKVLQKRADAMEMLAAIRDFVATAPGPFKPCCPFERTDVWDLDLEAAQGLHPSDDEANLLPVEDILDEIRLVPEDYVTLREEALLRALSIREAGRQGIEPEPEEKEKALRDWLRELGGGLEKALEESGLREAGLDAFIRDEALARWTAGRLDHAIRDNLIGALRARGKLAPFMRRAEAKRDALRNLGKEAATAQTSRQAPAALFGWFWRRTFQTRMQTMTPEALASELGFSDVSALNRAILREYLFSTAAGGKSTGSGSVD